MAINQSSLDVLKGIIEKFKSGGIALHVPTVIQLLASLDRAIAELEAELAAS